MLTPRQAELLAFVRDYIATHAGVAPTYDEMVAALGLKSKSRVSALIERLVQTGHLERRPGRWRGLALVEPGAESGRAALERAAARLVEERGPAATAALLMELARAMSRSSSAEPRR